MPNNNQQPTNPDSPLFDRVATILEQARANVVRSVNSEMVIAYWLVGREIVEEEQQGEKRAGYGKRLIEDLSDRLTDRYGKGFSTTNLGYFRRFYITFHDRAPAIHHSMGGELPESKSYPAGSESAVPEKGRSAGGDLPVKVHTADEASLQEFHPDLGWSHYRALMRVENEHARSFYELEAARNGWTMRQLERQIHSFYY